MSRRSPAKLPSSPRLSSATPSHSTLFTRTPTERSAIPEDALTAALKQISNSLANLDFDRFFKIFEPHTAVYRFIKSFDMEEFTRVLLKAFPEAKVGDLPFDALVIQDMTAAKKELEEQLVILDCMFKKMQDKGLVVGYIRRSLEWVRKRNAETYARINHGACIPSPLDDPFPIQSSRHVQPSQRHVPKYLKLPEPFPPPPPEGFPADAIYSISIPVPPSPRSFSGRTRSRIRSELTKACAPSFTIPNANHQNNFEDPRVMNNSAHTSTEKSGMRGAMAQFTQAQARESFGDSGFHSPVHPHASRHHVHPALVHGHPYHFNSARPDRRECSPILFTRQELEARPYGNRYRPRVSVTLSESEDDDNVQFIPPHPSTYYYSRSPKTSKYRNQLIDYEFGPCVRVTSYNW